MVLSKSLAFWIWRTFASQSESSDIKISLLSLPNCCQRRVCCFDDRLLVLKSDMTANLTITILNSPTALPTSMMQSTRPNTIILFTRSQPHRKTMPRDVMTTSSSLGPILRITAVQEPFSGRFLDS